MRIVLDTNVFLVSVSEKSSLHWIYASFQAGAFELAFTTEILAEYEEQLSEHWSAQVAGDATRALIEFPNAITTTVFFRLALIYPDVDDNKFLDCAFAANANYIVTEDKHYRSLSRVSFPQIKVVSIAEFKEILVSQNLLSP